MANIYVGSFKDIIKGYYKKQKAFNAKIADNNKRFSPEYAEQENKTVKEQQTQAYNEAQASINEVFTTVRGLLANANFINVESLTADRMFFADDSGFDLSAEEVQGFVERYKDNFTMLRLIKDWIAKHDKTTKEHPVGKYASVHIIMPVDMVQAYKKFGEGALAVCDKIYGNGIIMQDLDYSNGSNPNAQGRTEKKEYPLEIEYYGDENFARELFAVVGSGMGLSDYRTKRVPDTAKHAFDDIKLTGADANYYAR